MFSGLTERNYMRSVTKNQFFTGEDGSRNYLVNHDWSVLESIRPDVRLWITATQAAALLGESLTGFYRLVNIGKLPHLYLKTPTTLIKGVCIVSLKETLRYGIQQFEAQSNRELPRLKKKMKKLGAEASQIEAVTTQHKAMTESAIQRLRELEGRVSGEKGGKP